MTSTTTTTTVAPALRNARRRPRRRKGEAAAAGLFAAPGLLLVLLFVILPFLGAFVLSFTNSRLVSPLPTRFVGIDNYVDVLTDDVFWGALGNNLVFGLVVVPVQTALALALAVLVNQKIRGRVLFRTLYFLPQVMVMAAAATVWKLLFSSDGMANSVMEVLTLGLWGGPNWLQSTSLAMPAVIIVPLLYSFAEVGWLNTFTAQVLPFIANPFFIYLFYTFFLNVPKEMEEAARVDGAGPIRTFVQVVAPLAKPAYASVAILTFLFSWGQLLWPTMVTRGESVRPLPLALQAFQTSPPLQWGAIMAFVILMTLPLLAAFLFFQRQFVEGISSSGVKG